VTADAARARIFEAHNHERALHEVEEFVNPKAQQQDRDINTSPHGRYFNHAGGPQGNTAEPRVDAVTHEMELFAKDVSAYLEKARNAHRYDKLRVIAAPKLLGLMRQNLSKEAMKLVEDEVPKDISWFDKREIEQYLADHPTAH
jgi:protein required for attachment to host cells